MSPRKAFTFGSAARGAAAGFFGQVRSTKVLISAASPSRSVLACASVIFLSESALVMSALAAVERVVTRPALLLFGVESAILPRLVPGSFTRRSFGARPRYVADSPRRRRTTFPVRRVAA